ncbi:DUF4157 domain-containing protein [Azospirillum sp. B21]|uniref:eCIS core domain-containing protein n=1 Tax=Azospirillum sp. B21 TaxID=2607496 RepID=UPI0011EF345F|nr:DUF4157 domain-containing protein [Azospirillum sp. B21]KAA0574403.1 DUF4157 domain-containing protein [Azospirillum sp. B21]
MRMLTFAATLFALVAPVNAGGLIGDIVNVVVPGAGTALDDANRQVKEAIPPYKAVEEGASGVVRHVANEAAGELGGPALAAWIRASKGDVVGAGVKPMPPQIYAALSGYFPEEILLSVRYRSGWGNEVALPALSFQFGDAAAITLDDAVMFRNEDDAQYNLGLWAHEVSHVQQYKRWGVDEFAKQYTKNHGDVEAEAEDNALRFLTWHEIQVKNKQVTFQQSVPAYPNQPAPGAASPFGAWPQAIGMPQQVNICRTPFGACQLPVNGPVGVSCWCGTPGGPVFGSLMP